MYFYGLLHFELPLLCDMCLLSIKNILICEAFYQTAVGNHKPRHTVMQKKHLAPLVDFHSALCLHTLGLSYLQVKTNGFLQGQEKV